MPPTSGLAELFEFYRQLEIRLADPQPAGFLLLAAHLYAIATGGRTVDAAARTEILTSYLGMDTDLQHDIQPRSRAMMAIGYALSRMVGTDDDRAVFDRRLGRHIGLFPDWLQLMDRAEPTAVLLGRDGDNPLAQGAVGIGFATGVQLTVQTIVDLERGGRLLHVGISAESLEDVEAVWRDEGLDDIRGIPSAVARAQLQRAEGPPDPCVGGDSAERRAEGAMVEWVIRMLSGNRSASARQLC